MILSIQKINKERILSKQQQQPIIKLVSFLQLTNEIFLFHLKTTIFKSATTTAMKCISLNFHNITTSIHS